MRHTTSEEWVFYNAIHEHSPSDREYCFRHDIRCTHGCQHGDVPVVLYDVAGLRHRASASR